MENIDKHKSSASEFTPGMGWESAPKPLIYLEGLALSERLGNESSEASKKSWRIDTSLRNVRIAETKDKLEKSLAHLADVIASIKEDKH